MLLWLCQNPGLVFATPPETLEIQYNPDKQSLTLSGRHPTQDRLEHFIRRIQVTRNQDEPETFYLTRQDSLKEFKVKIPIKIEPGDRIKAEVFCSQGGTKSIEFQAPQIAVQKSSSANPAEDLKAIKDKDHQNMPIIP